MMFAGSIALFIVFALIRGESTLEISAVVSLFALSSLGTALQFFAFSDYAIKKMRYTRRMIVFAVPLFALTAALAYFFSWFPSDKGIWLAFAAIFLAVFVGMAAGFEIYYRASGRAYDGLLGQYRRQKEEGAGKTGK